MTQQDTQPPAETLANLRKAAERKIGFTRRGSEDRVIVRRADLQWMLSQFSTDDPDAALTRRAGGDAIPAGEACEALRADVAALFAQHGNASCDECGAPLFDHDETDTDEAETVAICAGHRRSDAPTYGYRLAMQSPLAATPKPPAGGDAGAVGWQASTEAGRKVYDHYVGGATQGYLYDHVKRGRLGVMKPDRSHDTAYAAWMAGQHLAALALPAPVVEGERWRHVKRGTVYEVIGYAELQNGNAKGLREGAELAVYRGEDGKLWARERGEFHDGRFAALSEGRSHG